MKRKPWEILVVCLPLLVSCGKNLKPYADVGIVYAFPFSSDYWVHSDRSWQCEQPEFLGEFGLVSDTGFHVAFHHYSMVMCGTWNDKPEIYNNGLKFGWRFGGHKK